MKWVRTTRQEISVYSFNSEIATRIPSTFPLWFYAYRTVSSIFINIIVIFTTGTSSSHCKDSLRSWRRSTKNDETRERKKKEEEKKRSLNIRLNAIKLD